MPRGKYDRKVAKIQRLEAELSVALEQVQTLKDEIHDLKSVRKAVEIATSQQQTVSGQHRLSDESFDLIRENLRSLTEARKVLRDSPGCERLISHLDDEITASIRLLVIAREDAFKGMTPTQNVPLPAQVPAMFQGAYEAQRHAG